MKILKWGEGSNDKALFDPLYSEARLRMMYGARSVLCEGHLVPDLPIELADVLDEKPLSTKWFSEKGKANLKTIKWQSDL